METVVLLLSSWLGFSFAPSSAPAKPAATPHTAVVKWYTWEEAVAANAVQQKKIFVDVYTDWCGWCKRMDQTTFADQKVAEYMNTHFYPVKLNAEMTETINFANHTFKYLENDRHGVHELAYSLLNGQMSYPSYVVLDEAFARILIAPGYQEADTFMDVLVFAKENHYRTKTWEQFMKTRY